MLHRLISTGKIHTSYAPLQLLHMLHMLQGAYLLFSVVWQRLRGQVQGPCHGVHTSRGAAERAPAQLVHPYLRVETEARLGQKSKLDIYAVSLIQYFIKAGLVGACAMFALSHHHHHHSWICTSKIYARVPPLRRDESCWGGSKTWILGPRSWSLLCLLPQEGRHEAPRSL